MSAARKKAGRKPSGRKAEVLRIEGNWKDALLHALKRGKPPADPPEPKAKKKKRKRAR